MSNQEPNDQKSPLPYIGAILIQSANAEELAEFYAEGFKLDPPKEVGEHHIGLMLGDTFLGIEKVHVKPKNEEPSTTVWVQVANAKETYDRLLELGGKAKTPPTFQPQGETLAEVVDPEGNVIGIIGENS